MYKFEYTLSEQDYLEFNKYNLYNSKAGKKQISVFRLWLPLAFMIWAMLFMFTERLFQAIILVISSILCIVFAKPILMSSVKKQIKHIKKDGKLISDKDSTLQFDENLITDIDDESEIKINYTKVEKVAVGENAIYVFISAIQAFIIPLSAFESEAQLNEFLVFINRKIETNK